MFASSWWRWLNTFTHFFRLPLIELFCQFTDEWLLLLVAVHRMSMHSFVDCAAAGLSIHGAMTLSLMAYWMLMYFIVWAANWNFVALYSLLWRLRFTCRTRCERKKRLRFFCCTWLGTKNKHVCVCHTLSLRVKRHWNTSKQAGGNGPSSYIAQRSCGRCGGGVHGRMNLYLPSDPTSPIPYQKFQAV